MNLPALLNKLKDPLWKEVRDWITLIVAAVAAFIYWFQLGVMQQNMKIDQRPWVVIKFERPQISSGSPVKTHGIASNIGKTPALVPTGEFDIALLHSNESPALQFAESEIHIRDTMQILYPADTRDINVYAWRKDKSRFLLTQADVDGLQSGELYIAAHGYVTYMDAFHVGHWVHVCMWWGYKPGVSYEAKACTQYNAADVD